MLFQHSEMKLESYLDIKLQAIPSLFIREEISCVPGLGWDSWVVTPWRALLWFGKCNTGNSTTSKTHHPPGLPAPKWHRTERLCWSLFFHLWALIFLRISVWWKNGGKSECVCCRGELDNPTEMPERKEHCYTDFTMGRCWARLPWNAFPLKHSLLSIDGESIWRCEIPGQGTFEKRNRIEWKEDFENSIVLIKSLLRAFLDTSPAPGTSGSYKDE